jgi:hypothetical protein
VSAAAVVTAATMTGAFRWYVHEVLTRDQLRDIIALARRSGNAYRPPGKLRSSGTSYTVRC